MSFFQADLLHLAVFVGATIFGYGEMRSGLVWQYISEGVESRWPSNTNESSASLLADSQNQDLSSINTKVRYTYKTVGCDGL